MNSRILLIGDDAQDAVQIADNLTKATGGEFEMHRASKLDEGLHYFSENHVDMLLLDLAVPESQGIDTFRAARGYFQGVPIVVITSQEHEAVGLAAVQEGAQDYIIKGTAAEQQLSRSVRYAIER